MRGTIIIPFTEVGGNYTSKLAYDVSILGLYKMFKNGVQIFANVGDVDMLITEFNEDSDGVITAYGVDNTGASAVSYIVHTAEDDDTTLVLEYAN